MKLETELNIALTEFFRPIVAQCVHEAIQELGIIQPPVHFDTEPYGDFRWLCSVCPGIPESTLRIKSAAGEIPGVRKVGKRVLYEKAITLKWLQDIPTRQPTAIRKGIEQRAEEQIATRLDRRNPKRQAA